MKVFSALVAAAIAVVLWLSVHDGKLDARGFVVAVGLALYLGIVVLIRRHKAARAAEQERPVAAPTGYGGLPLPPVREVRGVALVLALVAYGLALDQWLHPSPEFVTGRGSLFTHLFHDAFGASGSAVLSFVTGTALLLIAILYKRRGVERDDTPAQRK
jgi:hypothetical protein